MKSETTSSVDSGPDQVNSTEPSGGGGFHYDYGPDFLTVYRNQDGAMKQIFFTESVAPGTIDQVFWHKRAEALYKNKSIPWS